MVTDERHLLIPLVAAERAWSYAMELKRDAGNELRKRAHLLGRLKKATIHAAELVSLCNQVGSARTALEAEAYSSYMFGSYLKEQERDWDRALAKFMRARKAFEQLARVGGPDQAEVCRERLEELEPNLRYCTYKRGSGAGGGSAGAMDEEDLAALKNDGGVDDDRLKAVLAEESGRASDTPVALSWRGHEIPMRNREARACIANAESQLAKIESTSAMTVERGLAVYDKAFIAYNDARQHLRDELAAAGGSAQGGGSDSAARLAEIKMADRTLAVLLSEKTIERNKFLVDSANAKLSGEIKLEKGEKATRPEDLVHLFNTLLRNYEELAESGPEVLRGVKGAEGLEEKIRMDCMMEQALLQAQRVAALGKVHLNAGSHVEAAVLFARAAEHASRVHDRAPGSKVAAAARKVQADARKARCTALADGSIALLALQKGLQTGLAAVSLQDAPTGGTEMHHLMDHLDQYKSAVLGKGANKVHITPIPPRMSTIAVRPIVLDVAGNEISYPPLEARATVKKTSTLRNLFKW